MNNIPSYKLFAKPRLPGAILYDRSTLTSSPLQTGFSLPLVIDTEFQTHRYHWIDRGQETRTAITTQIRGIHQDAKPLILEHQGLSINRHSVATSGFHPVDYLKQLGYPVLIRRTSNKSHKLPIAEFVLYAHFALAEALMIVDEKYREDFEKLFQEKDLCRSRFEMKRHLQGITPGFGNKRDLDRVLMPWILTFGDDDYQVAISFKDTGAIHGLASYAKLCEAVGQELKYKDNLSPNDKKNMLSTYTQKPVLYDEYAIGDLEVYEALEKNSQHFHKIYKTLGIEKYFLEPRLTIGSTVKNLFLAKLCTYYDEFVSNNLSEKEWKKFIDSCLEFASAQHLRKQVTQTSAMLAKVEGGRCRNNRPTTSYIESSIIDLDISGCYGEGQRNQMYFIGKPCVVSFPAQLNVNEYIPLRRFLKEWKNHLVPGAWFARVSTIETLKYSQDFLASWFVGNKSGEDIMAKYVSVMSSDTEQVECDESEFNEEEGNVKILNNEVLNGTITSDFIEWLENICTARQRNELLDKLVVKAAIYYNAKQQVDSLDKLKDTYIKHINKNKVYLKDSNIVFEDGQCHAWVGIDLGKMLLDELLCNRKLYPKKSPLNELYKLCINTLYGDMTSKYFISANVVVGNNITARARALAWYMEKGLHGFQTITDGCAFELNKVVYSQKNRRITSENIINLYQVKDTYHERKINLKPLDSYDEIRIIESENSKRKILLIKDSIETYLDKEEALKWINKATMQHLQNLFPNVSVLHRETFALDAFKDEEENLNIVRTKRKGQFSFESKDCYTKGNFHGSANYHLWSVNTDSKYKFRSYETKKLHESIDLINEELGITDRYSETNNPAKDFMDQLKFPTKLKRQVPFVKDTILKPGDYLNRLETFEKLNIYPGDSYLKSGLLREFSLSQFTFQTLKQRTAWEKIVETSKEKYGQSIEQYFLNDDGTLNYQVMIETVDKLISSGCEKPREVLRDRSERKNEFKSHPYLETLDKVKNYLSEPK